jgi:hypothetical protein
MITHRPVIGSFRNSGNAILLGGFLDHSNMLGDPKL